MKPVFSLSIRVWNTNAPDSSKITAAVFSLSIRVWNSEYPGI